MRDLRNELDIECPRCKGGYLEEAPAEIWEGGWVLEPKMDGNRVTLQIGEDGSIFVGRNREDFLKGVEAAGEFRDLTYMNRPLAESVKSKYFAPTILDGELTEVFKSDGTYDEDTLKRQKLKEFLGFTAWTVLVCRGKDVRPLKEEIRRQITNTVVNVLNHPKVRLISRVDATKENLQKMFNLGLEGAIAKKLGEPIPVESRANRFWWKLKGDDRRTIDAFVIGVTEGKAGGSGVRGVKPKPDGTAATLTIAMMKGKKVVEVGKMTNLPDEVTEDGLKKYFKYHHKVAEVKVSGWEGERFRWPRFVKWRDDKSPKDCVFSEQVGKKKGG